MSDERLIEFMDKLAALKITPREDRLRAAKIELRALYDILPGLLGVESNGGLRYPNDDGLPWGRIDPHTGVWEALDKLPILTAGIGPPPVYWTSPDGRLIHVVHQPSATVEARFIRKLESAEDAPDARPNLENACQ